ncbi:MAG: type IX secretion system membrane protein PorP/SprF [Crocinitomicaceae bacterium]
MRYVVLILFSVPFFSLSQRFYNTDDYFSISNPSAFADKKIYVTGVFNFNNLNSVSSNYSYATFKHNIKKTRISVGFNGDFQNFGVFKSTRGALQVAHSWILSRKLILNSGLGLNATKDNFKYFESDYPIKFRNWNPAYIGIDAGVNLLSRKWNVGFSVTNLNQGKRFIDTIQSKMESYLTFFGSYDFKLDSVGKFHLVPSLFVEYSSNGFFSSYINLKFNFCRSPIYHQPQTIGIGYGRSNPALFYQYKFHNGITVGASIGKYISKLQTKNNSWNCIFSLNYIVNGRGRSMPKPPPSPYF